MAFNFENGRLALERQVRKDHKWAKDNLSPEEYAKWKENWKRSAQRRGKGLMSYKARKKFSLAVTDDRPKQKFENNHSHK